MLNNKNILIGITGGIAAYKVIEVARLLKKSGASVRVVMTRAATEFVSPRTFQEITGNAVAVEMFGATMNFNVIHVSLADFADVILVAPATANFIAKVAHGLADDLLSTTILTSDKPIIIVPSMNTKMLENSATQENIKTLTMRGIKVLDTAEGTLACGVIGKGRMLEPVEICAELEKIFVTQSLSQKKILLTVGGTIEAIDSVRYITNRSSGRMGIEIAKAAVKRGAEVILIAGRTSFSVPTNLELIKIETARQMREAVLEKFSHVDAVIMTAAVSDYYVRNCSSQKIKKTADILRLELVKNPDILKELGNLKKNQVLVGFAAETENILENAQRKLLDKNLDLIIVNDVTADGSGFDVDTNIISIIHRGGRVEKFSKTSKTILAEKIIDRVEKLLDV